MSISIRVWDLNWGERIREIKVESLYTNNLKVIAYDKIACSSDDDVKIWNFETGECLQTLQGHSDIVFNVLKLSNDIIASCDIGEISSEIKILNWISGECLKSIETNANPDSFKLSGNSTASCSESNLIKIWDTDTSKCLKTLEGHTKRIFQIDSF